MAMAPIEVGDNLPPGELFEDSPDNKVDTCDVTAGKKVIIFGVPGAFTPGSKTHLPGYVFSADSLKSEHCLDEIVCVSVKDPFVMASWGGGHQRAAAKVRLLADPNACFAIALDLTVDLPKLAGLRMQRFSTVLEANEVVELNVEPDRTGLTCSLVKNIGKK